VCQVQGAGDTSPFLGSVVTVTATVTARVPALRGFFVEAPACDDDPRTSNGIWVFDPDGLVDLFVWDRAVLTGEVAEYFGQTEIALQSIDGLGVAESVDPTILAPPQDPAEAAAYLEAREGMLGALRSSRVVGPTNRFGDFYALPTSALVDRLFAPDGRRLGVSTPGWWLTVDHGDELGPMIGPLAYRFGGYKLLLAQIDAPRRIAADRPPDRTVPAGGLGVRIASYNLENLFDPVDDPGKDDGDDTPSIAEYATALELRARSIAESLGLPHVVAVQEVENVRVLDDLAAHPLVASAAYTSVLQEGPDSRGIDVGVLYDTRRLLLETVEQHRACVAEVFLEPAVRCTMAGGGDGWELFGRPPLEVTFQDRATRERFRIIVNHFKSKSGGDAATRPARLAMARFAASIATQPDKPPAIVVGDLNDGPTSEALAILETEGRLASAVAESEGTYSFIFEGLSETLDYILVPGGVGVVEGGYVHTNVDYGVQAPGEPPTHRASDHDPVLATLSFGLPVRIFLPLACNPNCQEPAQSK
jgi:predicted extracellular nuclease